MFFLTRQALAGLMICGAAIGAQADPVTYQIDETWEFYTSGTPSETDLTNLTGWITFDRDINPGGPTAWHFELVHFDPVWETDNGWGSDQVYTPLIIEGSGFEYSDAEGFRWFFRNDLTTSIRFGWQQSDADAVLDGLGHTVSFQAYEYVQRGPIASQRIINHGQATLVPEPGSAALVAAGLLLMRRRRA